MIRKHLLALGLAGLLGSNAWAQVPGSPPATPATPVAPPRGSVAVTVMPGTATTVVPGTAAVVPGMPVSAVPGAIPGTTVRTIPGVAQAPEGPDTGPAPATPEGAPAEGEATGEAAQESGGYGPTDLSKIHILQDALRSLCGKDPIKPPPPPPDPCAPPKDPCAPNPDLCAPAKKDPCILINGWIDLDYTYRSTGTGINNVAPVMNRFGDEFLDRQDGIMIVKPLDKDWSWGFNLIYIVGADAAFLYPTTGYGENTNPRFGQSFTDLNLTAHLPILTDGGVDIKLGRQTTILGPMGALPFQRWFDSSDYAWYNEEEGRYTGVSSVWHISKQLDWYNGFELGWGTFYAQIGSDVDYITNISYWLDEKAQKTKVWTTVLTGPTSLHSGANTTVLELGLQENWSKRWYQIIDTQETWSKGPVNAVPTPGYNERAYDVYTYLGYHLNKEVDLQSRVEWYKDVDGLDYAGGFGVPHTSYYEVTLGPDYHPKPCIQIRPEIRYDYATHDNFGPDSDKKNQLSLACDILFKF